MPIKDLQARQGNVELEAEVVEKSEPREFNKFGKSGKVCNAKLKDETGKVTLTLWNEQVDQVKLGDKIKITNGYVGEWQGELQLSTGKFGKLEVLESKGFTEEPSSNQQSKSNEVNQTTVKGEDLDEDGDYEYEDVEEEDIN